MFSFTAHFFENEIYINEYFAYKNNEFLTELFNLNITEDLYEFRKILLNQSKNLRLASDIKDFEIEDYDKSVQNIQSVMTKLNYLFNKFSISNLISSAEEIQSEKLFEFLSSKEWIWKYSDSDDVVTSNDVIDDDDYFDYDDDDDNFANNYGFSYTDLNSDGYKVCQSYLNKFVPEELKYSIDIPGMLDDLESLNFEVESLCNQYLTFTEDILRFINLYKDFVDNYLHAQSKFLDNDNLANTFISFINDTKRKPNRNYFRFTSGYSKFFHSVMKKDNKNILCESYEFQNLGAFLYFDLFRGVYNNYIPKKCENCDRYFLIQSGKYTDYCENPAPQDPTKTCRDVGSRKKYDDKCKTDPIWQTYNRAYKAHYARYMKKKMTVAEFEKWSAWAVVWRTKAENDEISFDEYLTEIKL